MFADLRFYARVLALLTTPGRWLRIVSAMLRSAYYVTMLAIAGWLFSQAIDRQPPIVVHDVRVITPTVVPGGELKVDFDLTRWRVCESESSWAVFDGINEVRRFGPLNTQAGGPVGRESFVRGYRIPFGVQPGAARLRVSLSWQCPNNYLHPIYPVTQALPDIPFEIVTP